MKATNVRMPEELLDWLREKAARETIARNQLVSMNTVIVEILSRAKDEDKKREVKHGNLSRMSDMLHKASDEE